LLFDGEYHVNNQQSSISQSFSGCIPSQVYEVAIYKVTEVNNVDPAGIFEILDLELIGASFVSLSERTLKICSKKLIF
jgi:hypothetical protein